MTSIDNIRKVSTPQRAYEWEVELLGAGAGVQALPLLKERAKSVSIPETSVDTIIINYKGRKAHYAGRSASPSTVTVVFWEDEKQNVYNYFKGWMETRLSDSETGSGVSADQYTALMKITTLAHNSTTETGSFFLTRVFPISIGDIQLSYDQSEHMEVSVTFSFDSNLQRTPK